METMSDPQAPRLAPPLAPPLTHHTVQVVDDHHMMRLGLMALAATASHLNLKWIESANLDDALQSFGNTPGIDLVLLDLNLPDSKGLQGVRRFLAEFPRANLAVFSATEDEFVVSQALSMGAVGFVPKSSAPDATLRLVESLLGGFRSRAHPLTASTHPAATGSAADSPNPASGLQARAAMLNPTQHKVLELVLAGMSNQEIASECKLALGTVKNTVSSIMLSLDVRSRSHLISVFR
jgi:DNA-binding NarL/FixJ family response regulator